MNNLFGFISILHEKYVFKSFNDSSCVLLFSLLIFLFLKFKRMVIELLKALTTRQVVFLLNFEIEIG